MYRYYRKNDYYIMEYIFNSIFEFINFLDSNSPDYKKFGSDLSSEAPDLDGFYETESLQEAKDLCQYGYSKDFQRLVELKIQLEKYIKMSKDGNKQYNDYVGFVPDVKAYLEGSPLSMLNKKTPPHKHIDIYYNSAILSAVSSGQIFNRGAITLSIVEILENMGFSVGLNVFTMSKEGNQVHYSKFKLKAGNERLNMKKLYFPMCHPSFLRRLVFRLREETPDISSSWRDGYGITCDDNTIRQIIGLNENDIVICRPDEMRVFGDDIISDANNMFEYINKSGEKDFILEKVKTRK